MTSSIPATFSYYRLVSKAHETRCAEARARYDLACAIANIVRPWREADNVFAIKDWVAERELKGRSVEALALDWLAYIGAVDHGARPGVIPYPAAELTRAMEAETV